MKTEEGIIRVLPETLANKIAAGEVVQRPASVVKELMENALDAGADDIRVIVRRAGSTLVQVIDNGCGMGPIDAERCFQRHATSKIRSIEDLKRIRTLGFRGEALASIGSVAQVELRTRRKEDETGTRVEIKGGKRVTKEPIAAPPGTSVTVRHLFFNVPARRNFLKSPATEFKHILDVFQALALAHPEVAFLLVHDDQEVHRLPRAGEQWSQEALKVRILDLFGHAYASMLVPVEESTSYLSIRGFVGKPEFTRRSRGEQFLFVNRRAIRDRYLDHAVRTGYGEMLPRGSYPFYALFLALDPSHVDVNIHPTKAEVKFDDERGVYGMVQAVVKKALGAVDIAPSVGYNAEGRLVERHAAGDHVRRTVPAAGMPAAIPEPFVDLPRVNPLKDYQKPAPNQQDIFSPGTISQILYQGNEEPTRSHVPSEAVPQEESETPVKDERLLWQLHNKYILTHIRSGLLIMDQHAAHERILYERALKTMENGLGLSQQLLFPYVLELPEADRELLAELLPDLRSLGFDITIRGKKIIVSGVPADIRTGDERHMLEEILEQYKSYQATLQLSGRDNLAKSVACKSAIKTGQQLTYHEMRALFDQLFACDMPYACPHGRPTMIKISIDELDRRFGRIGHLERE